MSNYFDESEFDDSDSTIEAEADRVVDELNSTDDIDDLMNEAEKRFDLALYYKEIIKGSIFNNDNEAAKIVDKEIRGFARSRMEVLMGIRPEKSDTATPAELPFTEQEVQALKAIAANVLKKPGMSIDRPKPELNKIEAPKTEVKNIVKNVNTPVINKPKPLQKPINKPTNKPVDKPKAFKQKSDIDNIPDGEPFKFKGKVLKWETNEHGTRYIRDLTPQKQNSRAIPIPTDQELEFITQNHAQKSLQAAEKGLADINKIAAAMSIRDNND